MIQTFTTEGIVPQNWYVCNGKIKRVGGGLPYSNGCRLLHFTNTKRGFEYGLLVQNPGGKEKKAWAKFGDNAARSYMTLHAGHYSIKSRVCNWDQLDFTSVTYTIEDLNGQEMASKTFTPTVNIGGDTSNSFSGGRGQTFDFDIPETGEYVFTVYTDAVKNADFVLGMSTIQAKSFVTTGIKEINTNSEKVQSKKSGCYDLSGRKVSESNTPNGLKPGIYIINGRKTVIR